MVIVGIPGVGKTTIVEKLKTMLRGAVTVTFGTVMLEEAMRLKWVKRRDELRRLPVSKQKKLQTAAASKISKMKAETVIVDTHLFIRTQEGYWPGLPFDMVRALDPTHLVLIEAGPSEIASRRSTDRSRYRDAVDPDDLSDELGLARQFLSVTSTLTGAPMMVVRNREGDADAAAKSIAVALKGAGAR